MKTSADVQAYLMKMELPSEEPRENTWMVGGLDGLDNLVITLAGPVLVFRVKVMEIPPRSSRGALPHAARAQRDRDDARGLWHRRRVGRDLDALQLENLDYNEFAATVDDITLAVASHHSRLAKFREAA